MSQHYSNFVSFPSRATRIHYNGFWIPPKNPELGYSLKDHVCGNLLELNDVDGVNFNLSSFVKLVRDKLKGALAEFLEYDIVWITNGVPSVLKTETEFIVMWSNAKADESGHINLILQLQDSFDFDLCNGGSMVFDSKTDDSGVQEVKQKFYDNHQKSCQQTTAEKSSNQEKSKVVGEEKEDVSIIVGECETWNVMEEKIRLHENPLADAKWVANVMEEKIRLHEKTYVPKEIVRSIWAIHKSAAAAAAAKYNLEPTSNFQQL